jgi:hypothetical protein
MLSGRAALITDGYSRGCEDVSLLPISPDVAKRFALTGDLQSGYFMDAASFHRAIADDNTWRSRHEIECAKNGAFSFQNVPSGEFLLIARVTWLNRWARHGGYLLRRISVTTNLTDLNISIVNDHA